MVLLVMTVIECHSHMLPADGSESDDFQTLLSDLKPKDGREFIPYRHIISRPVLPDTADLRPYEHKSFWRASAETVGFNIGLWAFDRFVLKGQYAYISWNSIKENFRHGFEWDDDHLHTNMFAHPYNGSIFFNAGRSNGFNFWQSELFAIGGSAMWEMFMEREYPSTNDIITTPIGGAAIGEVLYRTSDLILDDRSSGGERFGREFAAFLIDPMRGFNRIVTGAAWKKRLSSGRRFGTPPISIDLSVGAKSLFLIGNNGGHLAGPTAEISIEYGGRFTESNKVPYSYFSFLMEVQGIKSQPLLSRLEIIGRLLAKEIVDKKDVDVNIGLYQHFDLFDSDTVRTERSDTFYPCSVPYKMGTPASVGGGVMFKYKPSDCMLFDGYCHLNAVVLAGVLTDFYRDYHRNYDWGSGLSVKAALNWMLINDKIHVKLANQFYSIFAWDSNKPKYDLSISSEKRPIVVRGNSDRSSFNHFEATINYRLWKRLFLSGGVDFYYRQTYYKDMTLRLHNSKISISNVSSKQIGFHLMLTYKL